MRLLSELALLHSLASATLVAAQAHNPSITYPATVQFDVIFPRNNTVYKRLDPFPLDFAVHNLAAVNSSLFAYEWLITAVDNTTSDGAHQDGVRWWDRTSTPSYRESPQNGTELEGDLAHGLGSDGTKHFALKLSFAILTPCNTDGRVSKDLAVNITDTIFFSFDDENGQEADILAGGDCAAPLGAIGIEEEVAVHNDSRGEWREVLDTCLVLKKGPQPVDRCAMKVDEELANITAVRMLYDSNICEQDQVEWRNVSYMRGKCNIQAKDSASSRAFWVGNIVLLPLPVLGTVFFAL